MLANVQKEMLFEWKFSKMNESQIKDLAQKQINSDWKNNPEELKNEWEEFINLFNQGQIDSEYHEILNNLEHEIMPLGKNSTIDLTPSYECYYLMLTTVINNSTNLEDIDWAKKELEKIWRENNEVAK